MEKLDEETLATRIKELDGWKIDEDQLKKDFALPDFAHAMIFLSSVGWLSESENRYRDIHFHVRWNHVFITLQTRDLKAITENDLRLAQRINELPSFIFI